MSVPIVCRPYRVEDAPALHEAILASLDHLRPWMPWVALEPLTLEQRTGWIASSASDAIGVFDLDTGAVVGGTGLHDRLGDPAGREIGYWVRAGWTGRGIATAAAGRIVELAALVDGVTFVEIHHDKANVRSRRVPEKLGFTLIRERKDEISAPGEIGISCDWRLDLA